MAGAGRSAGRRLRALHFAARRHQPCRRRRLGPRGAPVRRGSCLPVRRCCVCCVPRSNLATRTAVAANLLHRALGPRSAAFGANKFKQIPPKSFFKLWFGNLRDPTLIMLMAAAMVRGRAATEPAQGLFNSRCFRPSGSWRDGGAHACVRARPWRLPPTPALALDPELPFTNADLHDSGCGGARGARGQRVVGGRGHLGCRPGGVACG